MKRKQDTHHIPQIQRQLKTINQILNKFLKKHFTLEIDTIQDYLHNVKDLLIDLTTIQITPILTNVFSKFSNILQPFTTYSYDLNLQEIKQELTVAKQGNKKMKRRITSLTKDLQEYRVKSNRMTEFLYMLRISNIDIDELYKRATTRTNHRLESTGVVHIDEPEPQLPRKMVELQRDEWIPSYSNISSQYTSTKHHK